MQCCKECRRWRRSIFSGVDRKDSSHDRLAQIGRCYHCSLFEIGVSVALFDEPHTLDIVSDESIKISHFPWRIVAWPDKVISSAATMLMPVG